MQQRNLSSNPHTRRWWTSSGRLCGPRCIPFGPTYVGEFEDATESSDLEPSNPQVVDEFRTFVRPTVHPVLTDFCRELTGISQVSSFQDGLSRVRDFLTNHKGKSVELI